MSSLAVRVGVVQFLGSCDEYDTVAALKRIHGNGWHYVPEMIWYEEHSLAGFDMVVLPGGFSYGDYLRAGALTRVAPVMQELAVFSAAGGFVIGICNGFQVLCEAQLLPGALLPNMSRKFICRQLLLDVVNDQAPFSAGCKRKKQLSIPVKHWSGCYYASEQELEQLEAHNQVILRYGQDQNPNGSLGDIAGICNREQTVFGLMPHPEHAVDRRVGGSDDGAVLLQGVGETIASRRAR